MNYTDKVPKLIIETANRLLKAGFEAYLVGGCVRDLLLGREPKDWDLTTNARPEDMLKVFEDARYENTFGTVLVVWKNELGETEEVVEVTTYRSEQGYSDRRHPDQIIFEDKIEADLGRRDFTVNAMAMSINGELIDIFGGAKDLEKRVIRAVGEPMDRFKEDALRMLRALRFSCQLGFSIEPKTERAIIKLAGSLKFIANERIKDELVKILSSNKPFEGIMRLEEVKLLQYIIPELITGINFKQNHHHIYTVFEHCALSLKHCPSNEWQVRLASLLHDVGKPKTAKIINGGLTFYNHELIGARMTDKILKRLKFSADDTARIVNLVKNHMFYYNVDEVTASSVRRLINKVGRENLRDLIDLRIADRLGSGVKKAEPYKLRHLQYMFEKVQHDPVSVKMLKINGDDLMKVLNITPGPKIGAILDVLLAEVIEEPELNISEHLQQRSLELDKQDLESLRTSAKNLISEKRQDEDREIKKNFYV